MSTFQLPRLYCLNSILRVLYNGLRFLFFFFLLLTSWEALEHVQGVVISMVITTPSVM
jgi:hypothetical protein